MNRWALFIRSKQTRFLSTLVCLFAIFAIADAAESGTGPILWSDYIIPLPQEIQVNGVMRMPPGQLGIRVPPDASAMVTRAVADLAALYEDQSGKTPAGTAFVIQVGRLSPDGRINGQPVEGADRIKQVKHHDQAYLIRPFGSNGLVVAAWNDNGVFYGIQTLTQLLTAKLTETEAVVPIAVITDWPDMDERGVWNMGSGTPGFIPWMAAVKLNFACSGVRIHLNKDAPAECEKLPMALIKDAQRHAFKFVPHCPHYDYWYRYGVTNLYPEIVGRGDSARNPYAVLYPKTKKFQHAYCPCTSNPKFQELVTDWVRSAASQGAREIALWLTEFTPCECACEKCRGSGQFERETKASIAAIQRVRKEYPDLIGRIFFTLTRREKDVADSMACLALIPPEGIKVEKVYSRNKAFDDYAARGNWVANYSGTSFQYFLRYADAEKARSRILDYYTNHYSALYSMGGVPVWGNLKGDFEKTFGAYQLQSLAEWTWNTDGRDPRSFARAFATRSRMDAPDKFADWTEVIEPAQTLFSELQRGGIWASALTALAERQPLPNKFPTMTLLTNCLAECEQAETLASAIGDPAVVEETLLLKDCFQALSQLSAWHAAVFAVDDNKPPDHAETARYMSAIHNALTSAAGHLEQQMLLLNVDPKAGGEVFLNRFRQSIKTIAEHPDAVEHR